MATWQLQDAEARFSELVNQAEKEGPQVITRRGVETAVLVPINEWKRLSAIVPPTCVGPSLKELLLQPHPRFDLDELLGPGGTERHRESPDFE